MYKVRKLTSNNKTGDAYGVTIPSEIANSVSGVFFCIKTGNDYINFRNKVVEMINEEFRNLGGELPSKDFAIVKKHWLNLRNDFIGVDNPMQDCIILKSGGVLRE